MKAKERRSETTLIIGLAMVALTGLDLYNQYTQGNDVKTSIITFVAMIGMTIIVGVNYAEQKKKNKKE